MDSYKESFVSWFLYGFIAVLYLGLVGCVSQSESRELPEARLVANPQTQTAQAEQKAVAVQDLAAKEKWTLVDCINCSLENNSKIDSAHAQRSSKKAEICEAWLGAYLPTAKFQYMHQRANETYDADIFHFDGKMLLWDSGKTQSKVKQLRAEKNMLDEVQREIMLEVVFQVRKAFYELLYTQYVVEARRTNLANAKTIRSDAAQTTDSLGADTLVAENEQELLEANNSYTLARQRLNHLMGRDINSKLDPQGELSFRQLPIHRDKLVSHALATNPYLKQLEKRVEKAKFAKEEAHRMNYPDFYAAAFWEYRDTERRWSFTNGNEKPYQGQAYGAGLEVEIPIRGIGVASAKRRQAKAAIKGTEGELKSAKQEIAYRVEEVCNKLDEAIRGIYTAQKTHTYRQQLANTGSGSQRDAVEARKNASQAQVNLMRYILAYNVARAELDKLLGIIEK